jgi:hypothetical protein
MFVNRFFFALFVLSLYHGYQYRILRTPILFFYHGLRQHHIVIVDEKTAIDFTPVFQNRADTLVKLFFAMNIPASVRVRDFPNMDSHIDPATLDAPLLDIIERWNKTDMNLYTHNCQHFSHFFIHHLEAQNNNTEGSSSCR